jgi:hypothetical protein
LTDGGRGSVHLSPRSPSSRDIAVIGKRSNFCSNQLQRIFLRADLAIELRVLHRRQQFLELRTRFVAGGDQISAGDERSRPDLLVGQGVELLFGEVIEAEVAMAALAIQAMKFQMLVKAGQAEEAWNLSCAGRR